MKELHSSTLLGLEYNLDGNKGKGVYYTSVAPAFFRERAYTEIPFMNNLSLFAEEKVRVPIKGASLEVIGGVRFSKMAIEGYDYAPVWEPRFNARLEVIKPKVIGTLRRLDLRGGWGVMKKLPTIDYLYPTPVYMDYTLFQYRNTEKNQAIAIINTDIIDELLPYNLRPHTTNNMELGVDLNISGITAQVTYFREHLVDGITPNLDFTKHQVKYYNAVTDPGADPKYENGTVYTKDGAGNYQELPHAVRNNFRTYSRPDNRGEVKKWGIEYTLSFPRIRPLNTTVHVNGAYIRASNSSKGEEYLRIGSNDPIDPREVYPYLGVFSQTATMNVGTSTGRFNTNVNFVTNIPAIRMVVSLTTQFVWFEESQNLFDGENSYIEDANGKAVYGDYANVNLLQNIYRDPIYYIDFDGNKRPFSDFHTTTDAALKTRLSILRRQNNTSYYFLTSGYRPYMMGNIRLTKEIGDIVSLSFYANNFFNFTPLMKNKARPNHVGSRKNSDIYFGAELRLKF